MALISSTLFLSTLMGSITSSFSYDGQQPAPDMAKDSSSGKEHQPTSGTVGVATLKGKIDLSTHYGPLSLNQGEVKSSLSVYGPLAADETNFEKDLTCYGPVDLKGKKNTIQGVVQITGPLAVKDYTFEGPLTIWGILDAHTSTFKKPIKIYTSTVDFTNCKIDELIIEDTSDKSVHINLDNVEVQGKITITSGKGIVSIKNARIPAEKIVGAKKIEQD